MMNNSPPSKDKILIYNIDHEQRINEEHDYHIQFYEALLHLRDNNRKWESNIKKFREWPHDRRQKWCSYIEAQADNGLPMAVEILTEVIRIRVTK